LRGEVNLREALGSEIMVHFTVDAKQALTEDVRELAKDVGEEATAEEAAASGKATLVGRFNPRSKLKVGDTADVAVDTRNLHFFDPETGAGIYGKSN
jgi:multiple sugar transport system ATP-binding protein